MFRPHPANGDVVPAVVVPVVVGGAVVPSEAVVVIPATVVVVVPTVPTVVVGSAVELSNIIGRHAGQQLPSSTSMSVFGLQAEHGILFRIS
jgi:hypothetical protein